MGRPRQTQVQMLSVGNQLTLPVTAVPIFESGDLAEKAVLAINWLRGGGSAVQLYSSSIHSTHVKDEVDTLEDRLQHLADKNETFPVQSKHSARHGLVVYITRRIRTSPTETQDQDPGESYAGKGGID
jgi:hypothetical protein